MFKRKNEEIQSITQNPKGGKLNLNNHVKSKKNRKLNRKLIHKFCP
jgi:hypothetical protein